MTDQHHDHQGTALVIGPATSAVNRGKLIISVHMKDRHRQSVYVSAHQLLAMIDAEDPHAMHTYLRETMFGDEAEGGITAAAIEHEVPEADSPEDTDEPDPVEQMRESGRQLGEAWRALTDAFREGVNR